MMMRPCLHAISAETGLTTVRQQRRDETSHWRPTPGSRELATQQTSLGYGGLQTADPMHGVCT